MVRTAIAIGNGQIYTGCINFIILVSPLPPPKYLSSTKGQDNELTFTWTQQDTNCSSTVNYYNINSSNCGVCPKTTNNTNITCTNVIMNGSICTLTVEPESCGTASQVTVTLEGKQLMYNVMEWFAVINYYSIILLQLYSIIENVICRTNIRNLYCNICYVPRGVFTNQFANS